MDKANIEENYKNRLDKILNQYLNQYLNKSRLFCDKYCHPDGLVDIMRFAFETKHVPPELLYSNKLADDFDYFIFTKSTKTLHAIKTLLNELNYNFNEDIMILIRSIFEGHLMSRHFRKYIDNDEKREKLIKELINSPIGVITNYYFTKGNKVKDKDGSLIAEKRGPSKFKEGEDKKYYSYFYPFLCQFTHNSFGTLDCYFDGANYHYDKDNLEIEAYFFAIFAFTKLFEGVVTVSGENFESPEVEKSHYELVYDALDLQLEVFDYLIYKYKNISADKVEWVIQLYLLQGGPGGKYEKMVKMLELMKASLYEEIGSLKKNRTDEKGYFIRQYPEWD